MTLDEVIAALQAAREELGPDAGSGRVYTSDGLTVRVVGKVQPLKAPEYTRPHVMLRIGTS